jgi:hypothetical protein
MQRFEEGSTKTIKIEDLGPIVLYWSDRANRAEVRSIAARIKQAVPGWKGVVVHLRPGEQLGTLPLSKAEPIFRALRAYFEEKK